MGLRVKNVTGREIFEAIEKNGIKIVRETWFENEGAQLGACILGVAGLNLGVTVEQENTLHDWERLGINSLVKQLDQHFVALSSPRYRNPGEPVATAIYTRFDEFEDIENILVGEGLWDQDDYDSYESAKENYLATVDKTRISKRNEEILYNLSWTDAVQMAKDILEPLFNTTFQVAVEDYDELLHWRPNLANVANVAA